MDNLDPVIVIPVFNRFDKLSRLLGDLESQSLPPKKVVVVDHGTDNLPGEITHNARVVALKRSSDLWFTGAVNEGLRWLMEAKVQASHVVLLNDDVRIPSRDYLKSLCERSRTDTVVSAMAVDQFERVIYSGLTIDRLRGCYRHHDRGKPVSEIGIDELTCSVLPTRGTCLPIEALKKVGLLAEQELPQYNSDYEWTARALRHGYPLVMLRTVHVLTTVDDRPVGASGRKLYASDPMKGFRKDFLNPHRMGSYPSIRNYARLTFGIVYGWYWTAINVGRKVAGFLLTNYLRRPRGGGTQIG